MKTFTTLILMIIPTLNSAQPLTGFEIADKAQKAMKVAGVEGVTTMTIMDGRGNERVRKIAQIAKVYDHGETEKRMIRFLAPADVKGTGLLTYDYEDKDDDIWLYMPALRKTRRIVSSDKAKNFMGSEFSYADMTPPSLEDFSFNLTAEEEVNGVMCYVIEWIPNDEEIAEENGFSKRISCIGKDDFVIRKSVYYDVDGELHKELTVGEIKLLDPENKRYRAISMTMENLQNGRKSVIFNEQLEFSPNVKDAYFTTRYLERE